MKIILHYSVKGVVQFYNIKSIFGLAKGHEMKRITLYVLITILTITLKAQNIDVNGGYLLNHFHDFGYDKLGPHYKSDYVNGSGFGFQVGLEDLNKGIFWFRASLAYYRYDGQFYTYSSGLGSGGSVNGRVNKSLISLGIYPLGFKILKNIDLYIGFEVSTLICEDYTGNASSWSISPTGNNSSSDLTEKYDRISSLFYFGLCSRVAYNINITKSFSISPQYNFYLGLSPEFNIISDKIKSMRHYFSLGFKIQLRKDI